MISSKFNFDITVVIKIPTYNNTGEYAYDGIIVIIGVNNNPNKNNNPTVIAVKPVLPPALTPVIESKQAPVVVVPNNGANITEIESATIDFFKSGIFPSLSTNPPLYDKPTSPPAVSIFTNKNIINNIGKKFLSKRPIKSVCKKEEDIEWGKEIMLLGNLTSPKITPKIVVRIIAIKTAAFTCFFTNTIKSTKQKRESITSIFKKLPVCNGIEFWVNETMFISFNAINIKNSPSPEQNANLIVSEILLTM